MALVNFQTMGSGSNAVEFDATGGSTVFVSSPVWAAPNATVNYSFNTNPATTALGWAQISGLATTGIDAVFSVTTTYVSFYFQYLIKPATADEEIIQVRQGTNIKFTVRIDSAGKLYGYNAGGTTLVASGTKVLAQDTWYRLDLKVGSSATVGAYELKIDGVTEWSGTTNTNANNATNIRIGKVANRNSNTVSFFYGLVVVDDANYVADPYFYGGTLSPNANGSTMQWTSGTGASDYTQVYEIPPSNAEYVKNSGAATGQIALFDFDSRADKFIDSNATFYAIKGRIRLAEDVTTTSSNSIRIKSGSTNSDSVARDATTTYTSVSRLLANDPATSAAWTGSAIDAIQVGAIENNAVSDRLSWAVVDVLYTIPILPNKSDTVTVTESAGFYNDLTFVSESRNLALVHNINKSDTINTNENVINNILLGAFASDSLTVTELNTVQVLIDANATDTITATEVIISASESFINTSDTSTVNESVQNLIPFFLVNSYDIVGSDPPKYIYTTEGEVLLFVARSGTKLFYEKI
jgi:hypothetical protein